LGEARALGAGLAGATYGVEQKTAPVCYADDREAVVLGTLPDGRAGLVMKQHGNWTAIHSAAPMMPTNLLRAIAELGRVHCYLAAGDVVWASHDLVGVTVSRPGPRLISLPRPANVTDLYRGVTMGKGVRSFQAEFDERATRVFALKFQ
jgi:hypothetical protein